MYTYAVSERAFDQFARLANPTFKPKIMETLETLEEDPYKRAKETKAAVLGSYYVNSGSYYALTMNINEDEKTIEILQVVPRAYLYRLLKMNRLN